MAIARKAFVWGLFAAGGTITAFVFPALIALFLMVSAGYVPAGLSFESASQLLLAWPARLVIISVLLFSLWHAAHRMRVLAHDLGMRRDGIIAFTCYLLAGIGSLAAIVLVLRIG